MKREIPHPKPITFKSSAEMPFSTVSLATTEWNETGTWRYLRPRYVERTPACQHSCPTSNDIETWIRFFELGKIDEAFEAAAMENPFPSIMGRVCFHPCMDGCNRRELGGSVNINMLERALGDACGNELPPAKPFFPPTHKKVAIIGAGPAGLACAYHVTRLGHKAVVFEKMPKAGGMLRYGIPAYRLPKDVLDREISRLVKMGVEFRVGKPVPDAAHMQEMLQDYAALFMSPGAWKSRSLNVEGEKTTGVMPGLEFLRKIGEGKPPEIGKRVIVVGGGNTAVDTARAARRLGADVRIVYRRSRVEMPAFEEEIMQAEEEGVAIEMLMAPKRVLSLDGRVSGLECQKMRLGDPDESGRRKAVPIDGEFSTFEADTIMTAIGEEIDTSIVPSRLPIEDGSLKTRSSGQTEWQNVFAGGDFIAGTRTVVDALGSGKRSAIAIDCLIRGEAFESVFDKIRVADTNAVLMSRYIALCTNKAPKTATTSEQERLNEVVRFENLNSYYFTSSTTAPYPTCKVSERFAGDKFGEVHRPPDEKTKTNELARCFHCGRCTECDNCYIYCPDVAIAKKEGGFEIDYYFCKGCGVCTLECPRSAMQMIEEPTE